MADSQKFAVAAHALAYLAHREAMTPDAAVSSVELAASISTHPVVIRRVTGMLAQAGLVETRAGARGGAWLTRGADTIGLDEVLRAVDAGSHIGVTPQGAAGCPVGQKIPGAVCAVIRAADAAAAERLATITVADLLATAAALP
jgi:DNA-binding IscR family transcriptional regulator